MINLVNVHCLNCLGFRFAETPQEACRNMRRNIRKLIEIVNASVSLGIGIMGFVLYQRGCYAEPFTNTEPFLALNKTLLVAVKKGSEDVLWSTVASLVTSKTTSSMLTMTAARKEEDLTTIAQVLSAAKHPCAAWAPSMIMFSSTYAVVMVMQLLIRLNQLRKSSPQLLLNAVSTGLVVTASILSVPANVLMYQCSLSTKPYPDMCKGIFYIEKASFLFYFINSGLLIVSIVCAKAKKKLVSKDFEQEVDKEEMEAISLLERSLLNNGPKHDLELLKEDSLEGDKRHVCLVHASY
ncbi:hypothetical protein CLAVI_000259 [Candidatus Clavichlamydia salmonicola]|uniref:hypothetical protein n=1 Tax=Candidatus Clavichlamydia salmonicola TaxID=469812 RepID=UPI001890C98B|nr:hypothetical protein [Candidatus Clavichlamydia salmonicola]MBF5050645.1 hypothetical protein [Candidatus Clavichlamydia salmonicola]